MPSRRKKARALARDSAVTNNFFNQSDPNVCSCCAGPCRHKKAPNKKAPSVTKSTDSDTTIETLQAEITSMWKDSLNNLTTEQQEAIRTATRSQTVLDDGLVLKTLRLAHEHINDMAAEAGDEPSSLKTFALDNLKKVAKRYDEVCQEYKSEEKRQMDNLAELLSQLRSIASDTTQSTEDRLAAKLDIHNVNIKRQVIVPLASGLRQVQLFNIEKRFGLAEESYEVLSNDDREKRGEDVPADSSLSVRQKLNSPYKAVEPTPKPRQKKGKKKFNGLQALAEFEDHCKLAIKEIQDSGKTIGKIDESKELQSLTSTSMYADVPVPEVLPDHVRQRFLDAEFAFEEFNKNREMVLQQLHDVNATLVVWQSKSRQVWEIGKKCLKEQPLFRVYEYNRILLFAMIVLASRQEVKIFEFFNSKGAPEFPSAMKKCFPVGSMSPEEFEKDWETRHLKLHGVYPSVNELLTDIDNRIDRTMKAGHPKD